MIVINTQALILTLFLFVLILLIWNYLVMFIDTRNESEYRDLMEQQTVLVSKIIQQQSSIIPTIGKLRYFPDKSGFFVVLNYEGKILVHGDYQGNVQDLTNIPFEFPITDITEMARHGGGYIRYNYKGYIYQSFVCSLSNSPYIVCSGLFIDVYHTEKRKKEWKRRDKILFKRPKHTPNRPQQILPIPNIPK